jgi:hypothetical protein
VTRQLPRHRVIIAVLAILIVTLGFGWTAAESVRQGDQIEHQGAQIDALAGALAAEQEAAEDRGESPVAPAPEELIEDPNAEAPEAVGPTDEQVLDAVEDYFRQHPVEDGEDASPAMIAAAVINYLTEHPPAAGEPGPPPSDDQVSNAVATYLAANPPPAGAPGADGADGEDGHTPTSEEIQAELAAYLQAHPLPRCEPGETAEVHTVPTLDGPPVEAVFCVLDSE